MGNHLSGDTYLAPLTAIPSDILSLADYERRAEQHMPAASWHHLQGGAGPQRSFIDDRAAFERFQLLPRVLRDLRGASTAIEFFGRRHAAPLLLAPVAYLRLAHPEGELAAVRAAQALDTGMVVSTLSSFTLEEIAEARVQAAQELQRPAVPLWFQLYFQEDREASLSLVRRAEAAGYEAIVVTVDASIKHSGFPLPPGVEAANLRDMPRRVQTSVPGGGILFGTPLADLAPTWADIEWLRTRTQLPLIVKGILAPQDAVRALDCGADALVVSNHGGRVFDGFASPISMLPEIAAKLDARLPLLLDGGIRGGGDIVKVLALGASAVLIGRPQMHALAVAGMLGVAHALHLLRADFELAMAQLGCRTPAEIGAEHLFACG